MLSLVACLLISLGVCAAGTSNSTCKPNVTDILIQDFILCVKNVMTVSQHSWGSSLSEGGGFRIMPKLGKMTEHGKCTVLKKALEFYLIFLKQYRQMPEGLRRDLIKVKHYIEEMYAKTRCDECKSLKDLKAKRAVRKLEEEICKARCSKHTDESKRSIIFQLYILRNLVCDITGTKKQNL